MWCSSPVGLCPAGMFPTIFTLGIRGLVVPFRDEGWVVASVAIICRSRRRAWQRLQGVIADLVLLATLLPAAGPVLR